MLVFVPCSSKKAVPVPTQLDASSLNVAKLSTFAAKWVERVRKVNDTYFPKDIYCGNGISLARKASELLDGEMHIVSAGMSVVRPTSLIPSYNLTVGDDGPSPLRLINERRTLEDWWQALNQAFGYENPLQRLVKKHEGPVVLALPESYLHMIQQDLLSLTPAQQKRLRIITSQSARLASVLEAQALRFDQRFNSLPLGPKGANASFVQRALLYFSQLQAENPRISSVVTQRALISKALSSVKPRARSQRRRMSDQDIERLVRFHLQKKTLSPSKLLSELRSKNDIACEQKRFAKIYEQASLGI